MSRLWIWLLLTPWVCFAQTNSLVDKDVLSQSDSLAIFQLLDSLINLESLPSESQFALRVGYNSNINAGNHAFKLDEFGITTRAAFYHKSGVFLDVSGYWSNQFNPTYYLTLASIGYMNYSLKRWSLLLEYSRYIYHTEKQSSVIYNPIDNYSSLEFRNSFTAGVFFQQNKLNLKIDYNLLTGDRTGHRSSPTISLNFVKTKWLGADRISFLPTFSMLLGVEEIVEYIPQFRTLLGYRFLLRQGIEPYRKESHFEFGVMNYAFRFPVNITRKNWGFSMAYTYNIPKSLPGETAIIENGGYLSVSAVRYLDVKSKRKKS